MLDMYMYIKIDYSFLILKFYIKLIKFEMDEQGRKYVNFF